MTGDREPEEEPELGLEADEPELVELRFHTASGYGLRTQQPFVQVTLGERSIQVTPGRAWEMARLLIAAAESAVQDGFLVDFFTSALGYTDSQVAELVRAYRAYRDARKGETDGE